MGNVKCLCCLNQASLYCIADMIESYLLAIGVKVIEEDQFTNMISMIMFAEKNGIRDVMEGYRGRAYV